MKNSGEKNNGWIGYIPISMFIIIPVLFVFLSWAGLIKGAAPYIYNRMIDQAETNQSQLMYWRDYK